MRRWLLGLVAVFLCAPFAEAQFTSVTAVVRDPSGNIYTGCRANANFVPSPNATAQALISGSVFPTTLQAIQCDSLGNLAFTLVDNNQVSDGHGGGQVSQWRFSITSQDGKTGFLCTITISGATQNITAALQACAAPLPVVTQPASLTANNFFTGNNTIPDVSRIKYIDGCLGAVSPKYACTGAGVAAANTDVLALGGGTIILPSALSPIGAVNITSGPMQIGEVGAPVKPVKLVIKNGAQLSCNFASSTTDCIQVGDSSMIDCEKMSGATVRQISMAANSSVRSVIAPFTKNGTQESYRVNGCSMDGNATGATIADSYVSMSSMADNSEFSDNVLFSYNSAVPGLRIDGGTAGGGGGQIHVDRNWFDSGANAPCISIAEGTAGQFVNYLWLNDNECQNTGTASYVTITSLTNGHVRNVMMKNQFASLGGSTNAKAIDVNGCNSCVFDGLQISTNAASGATGVYLEAGAGLNGSIRVRDINLTGGGFSNAIFNNQTGYASGIGGVKSYSYAGSNADSMDFEGAAGSQFVMRFISQTNIQGANFQGTGSGTTAATLTPGAGLNAYNILPFTPAATRNLQISDPGGTDFFTFSSATQTLANKTLSSPIINEPNLLISPTAPTIAAAGCGGGAASIPTNNGTAAFKINVGTTPGSACTFTMPAGTTGWNVTCNDITTQSTAVFLQKQTGAESTTSVTITNFNDVAVATAFVASDILKCTASAD